MTTSDSIEAVRERRKEQQKNALDRLEELAGAKADLKRPVFFVPGWTDEKCTCWISPYLKTYSPVKVWLSRIARNSEMARYVTFTEEESRSCRSFLDFADVLKNRIWAEIGKKDSLDLVGHSMGGLDSVAAVMDEEEPLLSVKNLVTVATPHQGSELGQIGPRLKKYAVQHAVQCINLDPDELPIQSINTSDARKRVLERVGKLYCLMGTRDQAVMGSGRFNLKDLPAALSSRIVEVVEIEGATHSQKLGITQDPRTILNLIRILLDIELDKPKKNYGFIVKKT